VPGGTAPGGIVPGGIAPAGPKLGGVGTTPGGQAVAGGVLLAGAGAFAVAPAGAVGAGLEQPIANANTVRPTVAKLRMPEFQRAQTRACVLTAMLVAGRKALRWARDARAERFASCLKA
jgi:hypothetical protein